MSRYFAADGSPITTNAPIATTAVDPLDVPVVITETVSQSAPYRDVNTDPEGRHGSLRQVAFPEGVVVTRRQMLAAIGDPRVQSLTPDTAALAGGGEATIVGPNLFNVVSVELNDGTSQRTAQLTHSDVGDSATFTIPTATDAGDYAVFLNTTIGVQSESNQTFTYTA